MDYKIVFSSNTKNLEISVTALMQQGYLPHGNVFPNNEGKGYCQAMVWAPSSIIIEEEKVYPDNMSEEETMALIEKRIKDIKGEVATPNNLTGGTSKDPAFRYVKDTIQALS